MQIAYAILDDENDVVVVDSAQWTKWTSAERRRVGETFIDRIRVSTVFLGYNHGGDSNPLWFECMVFGYDGREVDMSRCATWDAAVATHEAMVERFEHAREKAFAEVGRTLPSPSGA